MFWSGSPVLLDNRFTPHPTGGVLVPGVGQRSGDSPHQAGGGNFVEDAMVRSWQNKTMEDQSKIRNITETLKPYELTLIIKNVVLLGSSLKAHRDNLGLV